VAAVCLGRGLRTAYAVSEFQRLDASRLHDPWLLPNVEAATNRLNQAIDSGERIAVFGHVDVDGVASAVIATDGLRRLARGSAAQVIPIVSAGYGRGADLCMTTLRAARKERCSLLLSLDTGTRAIETAARANMIGIDLLVVDHHVLREDSVMPECIVVNPHLQGSSYPFSGLSAAGLSLKLIQSLAERRGCDPSLVLERLVAFAAIGTVADGVAMADENRALVAMGCKSLCRTRRAGLVDLLRVSGVSDINPLTLAFSIGPRISALAREVGPGSAFRLLLERDPAQSERYAAKISEALEHRQAQVARGLDVARDMASERMEDPALVLVRKDWPFGALGAIAQTLRAETGKAVYLVNCRDDGMVTASCRGSGVLRTLDACAPMLQRYGGHLDAAGFTMWSGCLSAFADAVMELTLERPAARPALAIDAEIDPDEVTDATYDALMTLSPFGSEHPEPVFAARELEVVAARQFGEHGKHLEVRWAAGRAHRRPLRAVRWGAGRLLDTMLPGTHGDAAFRLRSDEFDGHPSLCLHVDDVARS